MALEQISAGDETTISYIDEHALLGERWEALRDYGFVCSCSKCSTEQQ
jgi:hypothetical protein